MLRALFFQGGEEAVRIVGHDAVHAGSLEQAHVGGRVDGPANDLQVALVSGFDEIWGDEIAANGQLTSADLGGAVERIVDFAVIQKAGHEGGVDLAKGGENGGIKRDDHDARDFRGIAKAADQSVFSAPEAVRFQLEIENDVVLFGEFEDFGECGDTFADEFAGEPRTGIEAADFRKGEALNFALAAGGAVNGFIVNGDEVGVAR